MTQPLQAAQAKAPTLDFAPLLRRRWYPEAVQIALTIILGALVFFALQPVRRAEMHPAVALIWQVWWPVLPFTVPFVGRLWCAVCPAGALGDWVQAAYRRTRPIAPSPVQRVGTGFALIGIVAAGLAFLALALESNGPLTLVMLASMIAGAVVLAIPYRGRVWCRWFCPLGQMLGLYSRVSWLSIGFGFQGAKAASAAARRCPQFTSPVSHRRGHDCIVCDQCVKEGGRGAVAVELQRWPQHAQTTAPLSMSEALAVSLLLGLLTVDSLRMTPFFLTYMGWVLPTIGNYRLALTLGGVALMGLMLVGQLVFAAWVGRQRGVVAAFRALSLALLPLVLAVHLALSAQHLFAGAPAVFQGLGIELGLLAAGHLPPDTAYTVDPPLVALRLVLLALGVAGTAYLTGKGSMALSRVERTMASGMPALALGIILGQPMSAAC